MSPLSYKLDRSKHFTVYCTKSFSARSCNTTLSTSWWKVNLRSRETADRLRSHCKFTRNRVIGFVVGFVTGSVGFVSYQIWTLGDKLKVTSNAHETERENRYFYSKEPLKLSYEDVFYESAKKRLEYNFEKAKRKILPWAQSKIGDPDILLKLAESRDADIRRRGLRALAKDNNWEDFQYRSIAQACSNQTMVSLARIPNSDYRLFRPMPWLPPAKETIESSLLGLLAALQREVVDKGIKHLTHKTLLEGKPKNIIETGQWNLGGTPLQVVKSLSDETDGLIEIYCLEALVNHSFVAEQCMKIIELGGLQVLQRVYLEFHKSVVVRRLIAWILANMSLNINLHKPIIEGGWVAVLHRWLESTDTALFFHTARALANLDRDWLAEDNFPAFYEEGINLAYPVHKILDRKQRVKTDIVFVHGLMGGPFKTWRQEDQRHTEKDLVITDDIKRDHTFFWPKDWLTKDVKNMRILNVGYLTELTNWDTKHPLEAEKRTLASRSQELLVKLERASIGNRPVIWVGHSMGGLLIKEMLHIASTDKRFTKVLDNTIGILFYSVPHKGSSLTKIVSHARYMLFPSIEVQELNKDNEHLKELHRSFLRLQESRSIPVLSFGETEKTNLKMNLKIHMVPPESSDPGCGEFYTVKTNHINVCKPKDTESQLYVQTLSFIRKCIFQNDVRQVLNKAKDKFKDF